MLSSNTTSLLLIGFLFFHLICADKQVVLSCGRDEGERVKGDPGAPGKRGAVGPPGPVGPKGNAAAVDNITREVETLKQHVEELQREIRAIPGTKFFLYICFIQFTPLEFISIRLVPKHRCMVTMIAWSRD